MLRAKRASLSASSLWQKQNRRSVRSVDFQLGRTDNCSLVKKRRNRLEHERFDHHPICLCG